jgi:hypothetical protein
LFKLRKNILAKHVGRVIWGLHRCTQGGGAGWRGAPHVPPIKFFEKLPHKNPIKLTTPSTPLKRICQTKPKDRPPGFPTTVHLWTTLVILLILIQQLYFSYNKKHNQRNIPNWFPRQLCTTPMISLRVRK